MGAHVGRPLFAGRRPQTADAFVGAVPKGGPPVAGRRSQTAFFASLNRGGGLKGRRGFFS